MAAASLVLCTSVSTAQWPERSRSKPSAEPKTNQKQVTPRSAPEPSRQESPRRGAPAEAAGGWSIVLELHSGTGAVEQARKRLAAVSEESGRGDVWVRPTERGAAIVVGSYSGPDTPAARADLDSIRNRSVEGRKPFSQAFFAPPLEMTDPGQIPELNLLTARQSFGKDKDYTLQIAFYQSKNPEEAKRAAERAALQLRREGELAFYYHGPRMSLVTVGVFGDNDFDRNLRPKNASLVALQDRYPLNLHNGEYPVIEKRPGGPPVKQPSTLVRIPVR